MKNNWTTKNIPSQKGKTIIITGANSGLGLEAAKVLSSKGARVIMAVRSITKGQDAIAEINKEYPTAQLELMQLDLSDLESIRSFADEFKQRHTQIDVLINNAGVMWPPEREETKQGFETQLGINHLGHFALTALLMDIVEQTPNSRIVTQSSIAHKAVTGLNFDDLNWEKSYNKTKAYGQSKLANLLFTYELDRKLKENRANTKAIACHPGVSNTNLFRTSASFVGKAINLIGQKAQMGALPMLRAATEEKLKGSEFIGPNGFMGFSGYPVEVRSTKTARDKELAKRFWDVSAELTGTRFSFQ